MIDNLEECSICLETLQKNNYSILSNCLHKYHEPCIKEWFKKNKSYNCPICNMDNPNRIHLIPIQHIIKQKKVNQLSHPKSNIKIDCCIIS
jgi:hypothetical protein